jgi:hypothetical protein
MLISQASGTLSQVQKMKNINSLTFLLIILFEIFSTDSKSADDFAFLPLLNFENFCKRARNGLKHIFKTCFRSPFCIHSES